MKFERAAENKEGDFGAFPDMAAEILEMAAEDQKMRKEFLEGTRTKGDPDLDRRNTARLKEIVGAIGWPTKELVGDAATKAWLLVQHADHDPAFQRQCLELMKAAPEGEVEKSDVAMLEDRVNVAEGKPQRYGSQLHVDENGHYGPYPIEDIEHLDERRAEVGLEPFAETYEYMKRVYAQIQSNKKKDRH